MVEAKVGAATTEVVDAAAYLDRIGYRGDVAPTTATLHGLHAAHLYAVPFENLDIGRGRPIVLDEAALFDKIVRRRRGGFCYELNGLFARLLRDLGFDVTPVAARFRRPPGVVAPEHDHLALLVRAEDSDEPWLADVGAGRGSFVRPLRTTTDAAQAQPEAGAAFRLVSAAGAGDEDRQLLRREVGGAWEPEYAVTFRPRVLADFDAGCRFHQTSPESHFTQGRICSLATPRGRVTLTERRLIETIDGVRTERELADEAEVNAMLRARFGIDLDR